MTPHDPGPGHGGGRLGALWRGLADHRLCWRPGLRRLLRRGLVGVLAGVMMGAAVWAVWLPVPGFAEVRAAHRPSQVQIHSAEGELLQTLRIDHQVQRDEWVALADLTPALRELLLLAEDRHFHEHGAVDWRAVLGALSVNTLGERGRRGASTLAMQTADLLLGVRKGREGRSWWSKLRQVVMAFKLEARWRKDEIFEAYVNQVSYRGELQGIAAAARGLFDKAPGVLSSQESALLAVLVRAPGASPAVVERRLAALLQLQEQQQLQQQEQQQQSQAAPAPGSAAPPPAAMATLDGGWVTRALMRKPAHGQADAAPHLGRLLVRATCRGGGGADAGADGGGGAPAPDTAPLGACPRRLDTSLQAGLQRAVNGYREERLAELRGRNVADIAAVVLDNRSGQVLAYAGTSPQHSRSGQVDTLQAARQAGSTLKPFIYALAMEQRLLTPASLLLDAPLADERGAGGGGAGGGGVYAPQNYDRRFRGLVSVRTALGASLNIPAVRALDLVSADAVVERLKALGLAVPQDGEHYGAGLALGALDVSLLALTNAYRSLALGGLHAPVCYSAGCDTRAQARHVMPEAVAWLVSDILSDNAARVPTFGLDSVLRTPYWTAVKTGTSKDMRDNWALGHSDRYTVGVWLGNANGEPMHEVSGVSGAAPLWRDIMDRLHARQPSIQPAAPAGVQRQRVRYEPRVEAERDEVFLAGTERALVQALGDADQLATQRVSIVNPVRGSRLALDPDIPPEHQHVVLQASVRGAALLWRMDGRVLATGRWRPEPGHHRLEVFAAGDVALATPLDSLEFEVRGLR